MLIIQYKVSAVGSLLNIIVIFNIIITSYCIEMYQNTKMTSKQVVLQRTKTGDLRKTRHIKIPKIWYYGFQLKYFRHDPTSGYT